MPIPVVLQAVDFGPYTQPGQTPGQVGPVAAFVQQMESEIQTLVSDNFANAIRLYSIDDGQSQIIDYAIQKGLAVIPSVYLPNPNGQPVGGATATWQQIMGDPNVMNELNGLITTLKNLPSSDLNSIPFVVIGNEEISQVGGWNEAGIESAIAYVKSNLPASVGSALKFTTAETYLGQYINVGHDTGYISADAGTYTATNMGLNSNIDVIFANVLPYWDGVSADQAASHVVEIYNKLHALYPGKEVVISETGWPSQGSTSPNGPMAAVPSIANETTFWTNFLTTALQQNIPFAAFEAYDEPNKSASVVAEDHWGLLNSDGSFKTSVHSLLTVPSSTPTPPPVGTMMGDPHLGNFDGLHFDFQAVGDFELSRSLQPGNPFEVQIRSTHVGHDNKVSFTTEVAANLGGGESVTWNIGRANIVSVDGVVDTSLPVGATQQLAHGSTLMHSKGNEYVLTWSSGEKIVVSTHGDHLDIGTVLGAGDGPGSVQGLLGSHSGQAAAFELPDGALLAGPLTEHQIDTVFADAWSVPQASSLLI